PAPKEACRRQGVVFLPPSSVSPGAVEAFLDAFAVASSELLAAH
ncbi:hypothetical protein ZWY2020_047045, partial [Hordeum vulgare]